MNGFLLLLLIFMLILNIHVSSVGFKYLKLGVSHVGMNKNSVLVILFK